MERRGNRKPTSRRTIDSKRILKTKRAKPPDKAKIFAKLVMQGQINSALRYLSDDDCGGVLPLTDDLMRQLHEKHPEAQDQSLARYSLDR